MNKKCKIFILMSAAILMSTSLNAAPVDTATAERVARNFWNAHHDREVAALNTPMSVVITQWDGLYIFHSNETDGFVIVSADDCVAPILAYSFYNNVLRDNQVGRETAWWLDGWQQQIKYCRSNDLKSSAEIMQRWQALADGAETSSDLRAVTPLLTTKWDQDEPYNNNCPAQSFWGTATKAATGCVATAMAQIMKYWEYPVKGTGTHTYYSGSLSGWDEGFGYQTADFGATTYDWANMPDKLTSSSSSAQKEAVGTLMYHCGVACDMIYGTSWEGGSGAFIHNIPLLGCGHSLNGMIDYFGYSSQTVGLIREYYDDDEWESIIRGELDAERPILYAGGDDESGGHCFVCDGYDNDGRFHFNWGWSGMGDGYYELSNLAPGFGGTGGGTGTFDFTKGQQILIGLQPHGDDDSLNIIRHFPYSQDFETAPAGWYSTSTYDIDYNADSYSWMVYDLDGCEGNFSAIVTPSTYPNISNAVDVLYSPLIVTPGQYAVGWHARALQDGITESYTVSVNDVVIYDGSASSAEWTNHTASFTVSEGDSVRVAFTYPSNSSLKGLFIDHFRLVLDSEIAVEDFPASKMFVSPSPTIGLVRIEGINDISRVEIYDINGLQVMNVSKTSSILDLGSLRNGIYIIKISAQNEVYIQKIVKL